MPKICPFNFIIRISLRDLDLIIHKVTKIVQ